MAEALDERPRGAERLTTQHLAAMFQLKLSGSDLSLSSLKALNEAGPGSLALCLNRAHLSEALRSEASALICVESLESTLAEGGWGRRGDALLIAAPAGSRAT